MRQDDFRNHAKMSPMQKYSLELILHSYEATVQSIRSSLSEFADALEIDEAKEQGPEEKGRDIKIFIRTEDPTAIFDICSQFGRIRTAKIDEV